MLNFSKTDARAEEEIIDQELDENIKNLKVLVVEDMPLNQLLMKTLLEDFGFERDIAGNGLIALEKLRTKTYDIILMDLQMPEMNGFDATDYIRNTLHSNIPIIALTADVTTVDLAKCKAVGMNDYIAKPVDERLLYSKIIGLVKKSTVIEITEVEEVVEVVSEIKKIRCTDLGYLNIRTKSNPALMMEMISLYLEQTPPLISSMKKCLEEKDWKGLHTAVHKMIPSFAIVGINVDFENMARKIQDFTVNQMQTDGIQDMVTKLGDICSQACNELQEDYNMIKNRN
jgi:CheY-like chemotaxis protein